MPGQFDPAKLQKFLKANASSRIGGTGTARRKHKAVRKSATHDDKRLKSTLSKLNVRDIPAIEEVNLFKDDGHVIHFSAPKVQASIAANTYVVSGNAETKKLQDLLPGIINQLGPDNLEDLKKIYSTIKAEGGGLPTGAGAADDDDEMPELVDNFEDVAAKKEAPKAAPKAEKAPAKVEPKAEAAPAKVEAKKADEPKAEAKKGSKKEAKAEAKVEAKADAPKAEKAAAKAEAKAEAAPAKAAEVASPRAEKGKKAEAKVETPKPKEEAKKAEAKAETPKPAAKVEAKAETPKPKEEAKKAETPKGAAKGEGKPKKAETPKGDAPKAEKAKKAETPKGSAKKQ